MPFSAFATLETLPAVTKICKRYWMYVVDQSIKWLQAYPIPDQTAVTCGTVSSTIHTNQNRCCKSKLFQEICIIFEIKKTRKIPRNPKRNGLVERFNKTLNQMITSFIKYDRPGLVLNLQFLTSEYRANMQESKGMAPNPIILASEVRLPLILFIKRTVCRTQNVGQ